MLFYSQYIINYNLNIKKDKAFIYFFKKITLVSCCNYATYKSIENNGIFFTIPYLFGKNLTNQLIPQVRGEAFQPRAMAQSSELR